MATRYFFQAIVYPIVGTRSLNSQQSRVLDAVECPKTQKNVGFEGHLYIGFLKGRYRKVNTTIVFSSNFEIFKQLRISNNCINLCERYLWHNFYNIGPSYLRRFPNLLSWIISSINIIGMHPESNLSRCRIYIDLAYRVHCIPPIQSPSFWIGLCKVILIRHVGYQ